MSKQELGGGAENGFEWITLILIVTCYGVWLVAGLLWDTSLWWCCLPILAVVAAFHTSLQHETIHGHPTQSVVLNEALVSLPLAVVFPYRRYRDLHLLHHNDMNLTDPYEDPESYFWPELQVLSMRRLMRKLFETNNTLVGRLLIGPALTIFGFARTEILRLRRGEEGVAKAWALHVAGLIVLGMIVGFVFAMPLWVYFLFVVYPALSLTALRSYAEHQAAENVGARSAIVETNGAFSLLYLNNNLHIVHHANPNVAWYNLPALYKQRRAIFLASNDNTLFRGYCEIARRFAFKSKQSVHHPIWYRCEDSSVE